MVSQRGHSRRGSSGVGCLLSLLLFAAALYYGVNIGQVYLRYYQLLESMRSQARLATSLQDDVIYRRLRAQADSLFPGAGPDFKITRGGQPRRIVIESQYTDQVDLPLFKHTFVMRPRAEAPL
jgi:hypothetical protein